MENLSFSGAPVAFKQKIRPLHWVVKIGSLKKSLDLLTSLGCRVLRHEEFTAGCEATCNGPYSGHWSKSMVGFDTEDVSFVFELTFNYGVNAYRRGNDLKQISMFKYNQDGKDMEPLVAGFEGTKKEGDVYNVLNGDFLISFVDKKAPGVQLIEGLTLNCKDLEENFRFWTKLGL